MVLKTLGVFSLLVLAHFSFAQNGSGNSLPPATSAPGSTANAASNGTRIVPKPTPTPTPSANARATPKPATFASPGPGTSAPSTGSTLKMSNGPGSSANLSGINSGTPAPNIRTKQTSMATSALRTRARYRWRNSWILGALSWEESLNLTGPVSSKLTANVYALTGGWARAYRSPGFEWTTGIRGFYGFADIGAQSSTSTYFQKNVAVWGATVNTSPMLITRNSRAGIGVGLLGFYRSAKWQSPGPGYSVDKQSLFAGGLSLDARWIFGSWILEQNIAFLPNLQSALWQIQIEL